MQGCITHRMRRRLAFQLTVRGTEPEDGEADREGESKPERLVEREREEEEEEEGIGNPVLQSEARGHLFSERNYKWKRNKPYSH